MTFKKDLSSDKDRLADGGFLHLEDVLSNEFVSVLKQAGRQIAEKTLPEVEAWHIPGKKRQYLFDFPSEAFFKAFCEGISRITGYPAGDLTIGERHIKVYLEEAADYPAPHMDRHAAEFTIGFPIHIAEDSRVCLFPHLTRERNTDQRAIFADLPGGTDMEQYYRDDQIRSFKGKVGDMFIFQGSTIYHERIRPAGCVILYIKVNAAGQDPLGEHASLLKTFASADSQRKVA